MGRRLDHQDSDEYRRYSPGCFWNMFDKILDHHYWHSVRWISPRRRYRRGKHSIFGRGYPKTPSFEDYKDEVQNCDNIDAEALPLLDEKRGIDAIPGEKVTGKDRIKAFTAKQHSARSQLRSDISVDQFENSRYQNGEPAERSNPIIILERNSDTAASRMHDKPVVSSLEHSFSDGRQFGREISQRGLMERVNVMEIFKINKKLFVEILQNPDVESAKNIHGRTGCDKKARLKKSESFPLPESGSKFLRPVTLENKFKESWFPKGEKFQGEIEETTVSRSKPDESNPKDHIINASATGESQSSSSELPHESTKHEQHRSFMHHLKDAMKRIKHTYKRKRNKESNRASMNAILSEVPAIPIDEKETPGRLKEGEIHQNDCHVRNVQLPHMRRVSSINESMDRYTRLFENCSTMEFRRHKYHSKSLNLTNEDKFPASGSGLTSFRRRLSLSDLDSFCPLPDETSQSAIPLMMKIKTNTISNTIAEETSSNDLKSVQIEPFDHVEDPKLPENIKQKAISSEKIENSGDLTASIKGETVNAGEPGKDTVGPEEQKHSHFQLDITCQTELSVREDLDSTSICNEEADSSVNLQEICIRNSWTGLDCENDENMETKVDRDFLPSELNEPDDSDFNYVRDILELSGLNEQGHLGTWHSIDQPLNPTLFEEFESYIHAESKSSSEFVDRGCDHQLLFDSINQVILQIYESSLAYFPKSFSFTRDACLLPKGNHILEEVWRRISPYRYPAMEMDRSLDDIIASDLEKDDRWMKLQLDAEDIALDIEDLIFDELVEEAIILSGCLRHGQI